MIKSITKKTNNKKGFTLIELIVVIAILGILAAIAIPRLGGFRADAEQKANIATARTIGSAISLAEADATKDPTVPADVMSFLNDVTLTASNSGVAGTWTYEYTSSTDFKVRYGTTVFLPAPTN